MVNRPNLEYLPRDTELSADLRSLLAALVHALDDLLDALPETKIVATISPDRVCDVCRVVVPRHRPLTPLMVTPHPQLTVVIGLCRGCARRENLP